MKLKRFVDLYADLLKPESNYFVISVIYGVAVSVLTLAIPISVQALVNTIAFGVLAQPLLILSILLLGLLAFSGVLKALQTYIIEIFQRHFYIQVTTDVAKNLMLASKVDLKKTYGVELVNRYFDIMTVQKKATSLITGGVALVLQTLLGLLLLAFYHPYFLAFDIILIFLLILVWTLFGKKAMASAVEESDSKYKVAYWLEEVARENVFFKRGKYKTEVYKKTNDKVGDYIRSRKKHFGNLFRQVIFLLIIYAFLSALILGLGGFLVINQELSLGQLVAAELIVTVILAGLAGAGKYLEDFYDLYAALSKIQYLYKLKPSPNLGLKNVEIDNYDLDVKYKNCSMTFEYGKSYLIQSQFYSSKLELIDLVRGFDEEHRMNISLGGKNYEGLCAFQINDFISVVKEAHFFYGSILENLTFGLGSVANLEIKEVLEVVGLTDVIEALPQGIDTEINPKGFPLWPDQLIRLTIAREILAKTKIIVAVDILDGIEVHMRERILKYLIQKEITIIVVTNNSFSGHEFDKYFFIAEDNMYECKDGEDLSRKRDEHE